MDSPLGKVGPEHRKAFSADVRSTEGSYMDVRQISQPQTVPRIHVLQNRHQTRSHRVRPSLPIFVSFNNLAFVGLCVSCWHVDTVSIPVHTSFSPVVGVRDLTRDAHPVAQGSP